MPGLNRFLSVTDQGYREQQRAQMKDEEAVRDAQFLKLSPDVQSLELEYWRLERLPQGTLTPAQEDRLADLRFWYSNVYRPAWTDIQDAVANKNDAGAKQARAALGKDSVDFVRQK